MAVVFQFPSPRPVGQIEFAWSPLWEALLSMRALAAPKRTPMHLPWVRRCRDLPSDLRTEIDALARPLSTTIPGIFEVGLSGISPDFADELAAFRTLDDTTVAYEMSLALGGVSCASVEERGPELLDDPSYRDALFAGASDDATRQLLEQALDDPAAVRDRYADVLARYWDEAFADEWQRILPRIEAEVTDGARALVTRGVAGLVEALLPEGTWDADTNAIVVDKKWHGVCDIGERGRLLFVPTVFGWPCVLIELSEPWPAFINFPLRDLRDPQVPDAGAGEVVDGLKAMADETRLQIAALIADEARSTKELSELLSLSDSAISRNLKIMESAGLVTSRRDGYFVLYQLNPSRVDALSAALRQTLGMVAKASGPLPALPVTVSRTADG